MAFSYPYQYADKLKKEQLFVVDWLVEPSVIGIL